MTDYISKLKERFIIDKAHHQYRHKPSDPFDLARELSAQEAGDIERSVRRLAWVLKRERPAVYPDEKIVLLRTEPTIPEIYTPEEKEALARQYYIHEQGKVCNVTADYEKLLLVGFEEMTRRLQERRQTLEPNQQDQRRQLLAMEQTLELLTDLAERYRQEALRVGNLSAAARLEWVPAKAPRTFLEALQMLRLIHYGLWASGQYHNTLGRFDQYMYPFLQRDLANGLSEEEALEQLEEFFLCCNKDSDLYPGMQQGDNGQSLVLGGRDERGENQYNLLSSLCLTACRELQLIDPKINLRVHGGTPLSVYEEGTRLTKMGLGFPQYVNDDVVIPCLKGWGYEEKDAVNYSVAACWELIVPGAGMDIPNLDALAFPQMVLEALDDFEAAEDFETGLQAVRKAIFRRAEEMTAGRKPVYMEPAPLLSLMMEGCLEEGRDISLGGRYNNYGFHGTGLATAVDSLAAIEQYVFREKRFTISQLRRMLRDNFEGEEELAHLLRYDGPKLGNDDERADRLAVLLLDWFADSLEGRRNERGGIYRPGTGSAMYYLWHGREMGATPDGRRAGEPLPCNYSPSLFVRTRGPISVVKSFARPHLDRVANGGPLTIELHNSVFRTPDSIGKVALFVRSFFQLGGHQMQINSVHRETLLAAKAHPEQYKNLIVRVWGWSGYFVELDEAYQDHIIQRAEMTF